MATTSASSLLPRTDFNPTSTDILIARLILRGLQLRGGARVPEELALQILGHAAYRRRAVRRRAAPREYAANDFWEPGPAARVAGLYLTTDPLPRRRCRAAARVTLQVRSADQGWADNGGDGTYHNSHTWFDACVLRPVGDDVDEDDAAAAVAAAAEMGEEGRLESVLTTTFRSPEDARQDLRERGWDIVERDGRSTWMVHHNITARSEWHDYQVDWIAGIPTEVQDPPAAGDGQGLLSVLSPGDKIALWARAEASPPTSH